MAGVLALPDLGADEGEGEAGEVAAATGAGDDYVRIVAGHGHLLHRLLADHGLMQEHVVEHAAEAVFGVVVGGGHLHRLGDGDAEAAGAVPVLGEDGAAGLGLVRRAGNAGGAVGLHERPPIGLLLVGDPDHVDLDLEAEQGAGEGEGRPPLPGAGLGRELGDAFLLVEEGLGHGRVGLVAAGRAHALVLVVDPGRGIERPLQPPRPVQRARPPLPVDFAHRPGDLDLALGADLLQDERHRKQRRQIVRSHRLAGARMQHRRRWLRQVRHQIVPVLRNVLLVEHVFHGVRHIRLPVGSVNGASRNPYSNSLAAGNWAYLEAEHCGHLFGSVMTARRLPSGWPAFRHSFCQTIAGKAKAGARPGRAAPSK